MSEKTEIKNKLNIHYLIYFLYFENNNLNNLNFKFNEENFNYYVNSFKSNVSFIINNENKFIDFGSNNDLFKIKSNNEENGKKAYKDVFDLLDFDIDENLNISTKKKLLTFNEKFDILKKIYNSKEYIEFSSNEKIQEKIKSITKSKQNNQDIDFINKVVSSYKTELLKNISLKEDREQNFKSSYFFRKNFKNYDYSKILSSAEILFDKNYTIFPMKKITYNGDGEIQGCQKILNVKDNNLDKIFYGSPLNTGMIFNLEDDKLLNKIDKNKKNIYLAEGLATALSIFNLLDNKEQVISTFNSGNLKTVLENMLKDENYKNHNIVICIDIDSPLFSQSNSSLKLGAGWKMLYEVDEMLKNKEINKFNMQVNFSKPNFPNFQRNDAIIIDLNDDNIKSGKVLLNKSYSDFNDIDDIFFNNDEVIKNNIESLKKPIPITKENIEKEIDSPILLVANSGTNKVSDLREIIVNNNLIYDYFKFRKDSNKNYSNYKDIINEFYEEHKSTVEKAFKYEESKNGIDVSINDFLLKKLKNDEIVLTANEIKKNNEKENSILLVSKQEKLINLKQIEKQDIQNNFFNQISSLIKKNIKEDILKIENVFSL